MRFLETTMLHQLMPQRVWRYLRHFLPKRIEDMTIEEVEAKASAGKLTVRETRQLLDLQARAHAVEAAARLPMAETPAETEDVLMKAHDRLGTPPDTLRKRLNDGWEGR